MYMLVSETQCFPQRGYVGGAPCTAFISFDVVTGCFDLYILTTSPLLLPHCLGKTLVIDIVEPVTTGAGFTLQRQGSGPVMSTVATFTANMFDTVTAQ